MTSLPRRDSEKLIKELEDRETKTKQFLVPTGAVAFWVSGVELPPGWLLADGAILKSKSWPSLGAVLGRGLAEFSLPSPTAPSGLVAIIKA